MVNIGKVKWFDNKKGYGFITKRESGEDVFVHYSSIKGDGFKSLEKDDDVQFELIEGPKGFQAQNVLKISAEQF